MSDYIAAEGPAWVWIATVLGLLLFGVVMGALLWHALGIRHLLRRQNEHESNVALVSEVDAIALALHKRIADNEARLLRLEVKPVHKLWPKDDEATDTTISPLRA